MEGHLANGNGEQGWVNAAKTEEHGIVLSAEPKTRKHKLNAPREPVRTTRGLHVRRGRSVMRRKEKKNTKKKGSLQRRPSRTKPDPVDHIGLKILDQRNARFRQKNAHFQRGYSMAGWAQNAASCRVPAARERIGGGRGA